MTGSWKGKRPLGQSLLFGGAALMAAVWLAIAGYVVGRDAVQFHETLRSGEVAHLVSLSWWEQPYTHFRLAFYSHNDYWSSSPVHHQLWHVREYHVKGVTFWTVLERVDEGEPASTQLRSI